jgi:hypothetical protein
VRMLATANAWNARRNFPAHYVAPLTQCEAANRRW